MLATKQELLSTIEHLFSGDGSIKLKIENDIFDHVSEFLTSYREDLDGSYNISFEYDTLDEALKVLDGLIYDVKDSVESNIYKNNLDYNDIEILIDDANLLCSDIRSTNRYVKSLKRFLGE